jgi:nucleoside-diphosphate-sugar epimerase
MKSRSVSVTGATGFLGGHIVEALRDRGWRVRAIVRPGSRKPLPAGVDVREAPLLEAAALADALAGADAVIHCAALIRSRDDGELLRVNVEGTRAVVEAANRAAARVVLISSQAAIGPGTIARPAREDDAPRPVNGYGRSKLAAEAVVRAIARTPWTILRPSSVYGPRDRQFLPLFRFARRGLLPLVAPPTMAFTLVHAADVARAAAMAVEDARAAGQALFVGHPEAQTGEMILRRIAGLVGARYRPIRVPFAAVRAMSLAGDLAWRFGVTPPVDAARLAELSAEGFVVDVSRARETIGFEAAIGADEGFAETYRWYREQGCL